METQIDPVCGMEVEESEAAATHTYDGKTYFFCCVECKEAFAEDPETYLLDEADFVDLDENEDFQIDME